MHVTEQARRHSAGAGTPAGRVLVAYGTRFGSTREIAARVADRIGQDGTPVDLRAADEVGDVAAYRAVVLGSAVFDQRWVPGVRDLVHRAGAALAARPVWLFSVGSLGDRRRVLGALARREPKGIATVLAVVRPRGYRVFAGVIDLRRWPAPSRLLFRLLGGRDGDNRDWADVDAWAQEISRALTAGRHDAGQPSTSSPRSSA